MIEQTLSENIKQLLSSYSESGAFPHTFLVEGATPDQRLEFSRYLANIILCTGENKPCGDCSACVKCKALSHPDLKEYGEINSSSTFKVEVCREIRSDCFVIPNDGEKKVYILKEAQNMNDSGENALLKIFEEPPSYVHFIMTCDSRSSMLETILSRATVISLSNTGDVSYDEKILSSALNVASAVCENGTLPLMKALGVFEKDKDSFKKMLLCLADVFKDALKLKNGSNGDRQFKDVSERLVSRLTADKLYRLYNTANELYSGLIMNQNYNLLLCSACYKMHGCAAN